MSSFNQFTNQYQLSKTLRFELKPIGNTQLMLEENKVFEKDHKIQMKYEQTKPYFNQLHREFVKEALKNVDLSGLTDYFEIFKKWKKDKKANQKKLQEKEKALRKEVVTFFDGNAKKWAEDYKHLNIKQENIEMLFKEEVFQILRERYGNESETKILNEKNEQVSIFDSWKGFTGYFGKFFETRKNFYKDDGTSTAISTRIIDQNLKRFCDNMEELSNIKEKIGLSEVENTFKKPLNEIFSLNFYNQCLLQEGIDFYNAIIGGDSTDQNKKGINQYINLHRQNTGEKIPFLKALDKQILSEKEVFMDEIESPEQLLEMLKTFHKTAEEKTKTLKHLFEDFVINNQKYDLSQIYLSKEALNTISHRWTNETETWEESLFEVLKKEKILSSAGRKKDGGFSFPEFISLIHLKESLENLPKELKFWKERYALTLEVEGAWEKFLKIFEFEFSSLFERKTTDENGKEKIVGYGTFKKNLEELLKNFQIDSDSKIVIKNFADEVLHIYQIAKYFSLEKKRKWSDEYETGDFYENPDFGYKKFYENSYEEIVQAYNKLRNYLTKKPWEETNKWKLNFENPTLADGWDRNKETDNSAILLLKDEKYYLGLMKKGNNKLFEKYTEGTPTNSYKKIVYKFFPDQAKMFPKVCFSAKGLEFFQPSEKIVNIYKDSSFKKGESFSIESMQALIDFYKDCLNKYEGWKGYSFRHLKPTEKYRENIGEFFRDVAEDGYKISFQDISEEYIDQKNQNGELYLFQISNKDWNEGSKGSKNLHTLYFEGLFSEENRKMNFSLKLNGQAEIFYRPKTEADKLGKKADNKGKTIVNHKRYNENKIFFHVPLTFNRTQTNSYQFNTGINDFLVNNPDINIIGVDRGEKHLAYYTAINQNAEILKDEEGSFVSGSLNFVGKDSQGAPIDYHQKLEEKAKNREQARKDWQTIEGIKDLKKGYISQVVRKLADLAIKHNAIIIFEDLNMRFKQIRGGIEKSVYQQLEKALIEKLSFLVNKGEKDADKAGHLLRAYQLCAPFETFQKMGKQTGIVFYTQAAYTSRMDPITGWRPHLYLKYSSAEKAKGDILKFSSIEFTNNRFEFTYDIKNFRNQKEHTQNTVWTMCSNVERFRWDRNMNNKKGGYNHYKNITDEFQKICNDQNIDFLNGDIKGQIETIEAKGNEKFFKDFIYFFNLLCQIRNTDENALQPDHQDFILSPILPLFDSRKSEQFGKNLPKNGDENGSFNIARKGLIILRKITDFSDQHGNCKKMNWGDLYVSNGAWDDFVQKKEVLQLNHIRVNKNVSNAL